MDSTFFVGLNDVGRCLTWHLRKRHIPANNSVLHTIDNSEVGLLEWVAHYGKVYREIVQLETANGFIYTYLECHNNVVPSTKWVTKTEPGLDIPHDIEKGIIYNPLTIEDIADLEITEGNEDCNLEYYITTPVLY